MSPPRNLTLTDEEAALRSSVQAFLAARAPLRDIRRLRDEAGDGFDPRLWRDLSELGWTASPYVADVGGMDLGMMPLGILAHELGRTLANTPMLSQVLALTCLEASARPCHRVAARGLLDGDGIATLAFQEGAGIDADRLGLVAIHEDNTLWLHGRKDFVLDGEAATTIVVAARLDHSDGPLLLCTVDPKVECLTRTGGRLLDGRAVSTVEFAGTAVSRDAVIAIGHEAEVALGHALRRGTAIEAAELAGGAEAALALTVTHLKARHQFGVPLGSFQALQHRAARMLVAVELSTAMSRSALAAMDNGVSNVDEIVSSAKVHCQETLQLVAAEGVQMHGGLGMTDEADIGLFLKRARVGCALLGDSQYHCGRVAASAGL